MKKILAFILCVIIGLSATACGKNSNEEKTVYQIGDTVTLKNWELTVTDVSFVDEEEDSEMKRVLVNCTVKNIGKKEAEFFDYGLLEKKDKAILLYDNWYEYKAISVWGDDNDLQNENIIPLASASGHIQFRVPEVVADSQEELVFQFSCGWYLAVFQLR